MKGEGPERKGATPKRARPSPKPKLGPGVAAKAKRKGRSQSATDLAEMPDFAAVDARQLDAQVAKLKREIAKRKREVAKLRGGPPEAGERPRGFSAERLSALEFKRLVVDGSRAAAKRLPPERRRALEHLCDLCAEVETAGFLARGDAISWALGLSHEPAQDSPGEPLLKLASRAYDRAWEFARAWQARREAQDRAPDHAKALARALRALEIDPDGNWPPPRWLLPAIRDAAAPIGAQGRDEEFSRAMEGARMLFAWRKRLLAKPPPRRGPKADADVNFFVLRLAEMFTLATRRKPVFSRRGSGGDRPWTMAAFVELVLQVCGFPVRDARARLLPMKRWGLERLASATSRDDVLLGGLPSVLRAKEIGLGPERLNPPRWA